MVQGSTVFPTESGFEKLMSACRSLKPLHTEKQLVFLNVWLIGPQEIGGGGGGEERREEERRGGKGKERDQ